MVEFVNNSQTPLTIALQGEWGSGKTSLMNVLEDELCNKHGAKFYRVWINSWQYSMMKTPEEAILKIVEGMIQQILETQKDIKGKNESIEKIKSIFSKISLAGGKFIAKQIVDAAGGNADFVDGLFGGEGSEGAEIGQMKKEIEKLINEIINNSKDNLKEGFLFFIDDLDRIDPPVAVKILELLKNLFDLDNCIFILAIDYDVVIKGLEPKFGKLTDKNEREFRSFFDKIIQMPFTMPVSNYRIEKFLIKAFQNIAYITENEAKDEIFSAKLTEFAELSVGQNPRALKRLTNTLSLINIINKHENSESISESETINNSNTKLIGYAMVCLQIAYPFIYNKLVQMPNFTAWSDETAVKLGLQTLNEEQIKRLNCTSEFDEKWEKVLFQICQKEVYSSNKVFEISSLLNNVRNLIPKESDLGDVLSQVLEKSAVTNLSAFERQKPIALSRKDNLKIMKDFAFDIQGKLKDFEFDDKHPGIGSLKSLARAELFRIIIRTENTKFKDYVFYYDLTATSSEGLWAALRASKNNVLVDPFEKIFDNIYVFLKNDNFLRSGYCIGWKTYPYNFRHISDEMLKQFSDNNIRENIVNDVSDDIRKYILNISEFINKDI